MVVDGVSLLAVAMICVSTVLTVVSLVIKRRVIKGEYMDKYLELKPLPGPRNLPIVGSFHVIGRYDKPWDGFSALRKQFGDIYGVKLGSVNCVVISSVEAIREVLSTKGNQFENRLNSLRFHTLFRGNRAHSIALCDWSTKQKTRRKIACPFLHPRASSLAGDKLNTYIRTELDEMVTILQPLQNQIIEPRYHLLIATGNIFFQFLCSKRFSHNDEMFRKVVLTYNEIFQDLFQGFAVDFMPWLKVFNSGRLKTLEHMAKSVPEFTDMIFKERREYKGERRGDLIDLLIEHSNGSINKDEVGLTQTEIEVIIDDLLGGQSVLANSWLWGLFFLADHPEVKARIRKEVTDVTQNMRRPSIEDVGGMPYTFATMMETLRVVSSPIIPHVASEDTSIMGYKVYKDTMVLFNTIDINMDTKYWDQPRVFNPERFLDAEGKFLKPDYFIPFSVGKRACLGDCLVKNTIFLGLATLLQCFDVVLPPDTKGPDIYDVPGDLLPKNEIKLVFKPLS